MKRVLFTENRIGRRLAAFALAAAVTASGIIWGLKVPARADEMEELQTKQTDLQNQKDEVQKQIDELETQQMSALQKKALLDEQIALTRQEIGVVDEQISAYEEQITEKEAEVAQKKTEETLQLLSYEERIRAMEECGDVTYYQVLFGASSFSDLLSRLDCIREIMECDEALYDSLVDARMATQEAQSNLELGKAELEAKRQEMKNLEDQQTSQLADAAAVVQEIEDNIGEYQEISDQLTAEENAVQEQINAIIAEREAAAAAAEEAARQAAEEAARAAQQAESGEESSSDSGSGSSGSSEYYNTTPVCGSYLWPVDCTLITSEFGWRWHPVLGGMKYHSGVDIGADYGQCIYAAASGEVVTSEYEEGYGNYVVIYHDDGTQTLYGHMSQLGCSVGDYVSQGQVIGYVGETGYATGPHLHFEIWVGGERVDPLLYF